MYKKILLALFLLGLSNVYATYAMNSFESEEYSYLRQRVGQCKRDAIQDRRFEAQNHTGTGVEGTPMPAGHGWPNRYPPCLQCVYNKQRFSELCKKAGGAAK